LDGKVTALDANNRGEKRWTLDFKDGPMLSSSIHRREVLKFLQKYFLILSASIIYLKYIWITNKNIHSLIIMDNGYV